MHVAVSLQHIVHAPAREPEALPPGLFGLVDAASAGVSVSGQQLGARTKSARVFVERAKAPGARAEPAEIFGVSAEMRAFPIEQRRDLGAVDHQIAVAKIAVQKHARAL